MYHLNVKTEEVLTDKEYKNIINLQKKRSMCSEDFIDLNQYDSYYWEKEEQWII